MLVDCAATVGADWNTTEMTRQHRQLHFRVEQCGLNYSYELK